MKKITTTPRGQQNLGIRVRFLHDGEIDPFVGWNYNERDSRWNKGEIAWQLASYYQVPDIWRVEECTEDDYSQWVLQNIL